MVETPVLFETFVRVDYARQEWNAIKKAQPKKIYFYSNKGRAEKEGEVECNNEIRSWINEIDWDCELHTWFREECVDVYTSLRGAVDWICEHEEQWIVLEDDVVPTPAFFSFCDQMIEKFKDEKNVWYISGDNFYNLNPSGYDYIFSRYHWMYGWATWRDRWKKIKWGDFGMEKLLNESICYKLYKTKNQAIKRERQICDIKDMVLKTNCWDYAFGLTVDSNLGFGVFPIRHLIHNIGISGQHHDNPVITFVNVEPSYSSDIYTVKKDYPVCECDMDYDYLYIKNHKKNNYLGRIVYFLKHPQNLFGRIISKLIEK